MSNPVKPKNDKQPVYLQNLMHLEFPRLEPRFARMQIPDGGATIPEEMAMPELFVREEGNLQPFVRQETASQEATSRETTSGETDSPVSASKVSSPDSVAYAMKSTHTIRQKELIIYHHRTTKPLNNRWAFSTDVINYAQMFDWIQPLDRSRLAGMKKIKVCRLPWREMLYLMRCLPDTVEQLDIELFEAVINRTQIFDLPSLHTLSIESFTTSSASHLKNKDDLRKGTAFARFNAPNLHKLCLGKPSHFSKVTLVLPL